MSTALVALERQLAPLAPRFAQVLPATLSPDRLIRTVMVSVERLPKLLECDRQSLFNAAMSAAILGLEVDGVTGQAFLIPFKNRVQLVIGYKGYNTIGARSGVTITGEVAREGDAFDFDEGEGWVTHKKLLTGPSRRIVAAWSKAAANGRPAVVKVLSIDDLMAVKAKSPGASRGDSPWNDPAIGFPAMCEKTAKRRLARSLPLNIMQAAARMDEAFDEQGKPGWISPDRGVVIEGEIMEPLDTPSADDLISPPSKTAAEPAPSAGADPPQGGAGEGSGDVIAELDRALGEAASRGAAALQEEWSTIHPTHQKTLKAALDRRHKPAAVAADKAAEQPA